MAKIKTHMIIDASGSMSGVVSQVRSGVAEYAHSMKEGDWLSITEFEGRRINQVVTKCSKKDMAKKPYVLRCGGMTNLYDAVGTVLKDVLKKKDLKGRIVVITTDGFENNSQEFDLEKVRKLIAKFEKKGGVIQYMSASGDPFGDAAKMGISRRHTAAYSEVNTISTFSTTANVKERVRHAMAHDEDIADAAAYSEDERKALAE